LLYRRLVPGLDHERDLGRLLREDLLDQRWLRDDDVDALSLIDAHLAVGDQLAALLRDGPYRGLALRDQLCQRTSPGRPVTPREQVSTEFMTPSVAHHAPPPGVLRFAGTRQTPLPGLPRRRRENELRAFRQDHGRVPGGEIDGCEVACP